MAVKVLRPGVERAFRQDVDAFWFIAKTIEFLAPSSRRLRPRAVIAHFEGVVMTELDLRLEAAAAAEFRANTAGDEGFAVPEVLWAHSARRVMTLEWVDGDPLGDVDLLAARGHHLVPLGSFIIRSFLRHALRDGFFHADMHQGNLKLARDGTLAVVGPMADANAGLFSDYAGDSKCYGGGFDCDEALVRTSFCCLAAFRSRGCWRSSG